MGTNWIKIEAWPSVYNKCKIFLDLQKTDTLKELLTDSLRKEDLVLFGEGNFTFSIAIAVLRQSSWKGITVTCFEEEKQLIFRDAQLKAIECVISNAENVETETENERDPSKIVETIRKIVTLDPMPPIGVNVGVDATNIPHDLSVEGKVVWFQCPWPAAENHGLQPYNLIKGFLDHMAEKRISYALVGITTHAFYVGRYNIPDILDVPQGGPASSRLPQYEFIGADVTLINEILLHGYKHEGIVRDIHKEIVDYHITLVFRRRLIAGVQQRET